MILLRHKTTTAMTLLCASIMLPVIGCVLQSTYDEALKEGQTTKLELARALEEQSVLARRVTDMELSNADAVREAEAAAAALQEAKEKGIAYEVTRYGIDDLDRAIADSAAHGWVKVLTVPGKDRILGATIAGEHAGDLISEFVTAMRHGLGLNKILGTIHIYPTLAEANKYAAGVWKKAHAPQRLLARLEKFHAWMRGAKATSKDWALNDSRSSSPR